MVMSTDIHRRPDGEVISNNTRLEKSVSQPEAGEARRHHRQNDILLTSDSGIDGTDFPLEISCKIYCNGKKISEPKPAGRFSRRDWDLGLVESCINDTIDAELKGFSDYNLKRRSVIIRSANGRGRVTRYDIDDFSFENLEKINESCDHVYRAAKCQSVNVSFEVKIEYDAKTFSKATSKKNRYDTSGEIPSSPPPLPKSSRHREGKIERQLDARFERLERAGDFEHRIIAEWRCKDEHCPSFSGICWIDPTTKIHYPVDTTQQRSWANDCEAGRALVTQPNVRLIDLWRIGNGQMNRDYKRPNQKEKRSALDRMLDMSERALEMKMTKAAHSAMEEALRDENRQQQQYSVAPFQQHGYVSAFPQFPPPLPQYPFQQATPPYRHLGVQSSALVSVPTRSSPIPVDGNDDDVVAAFFSWKIAEERRSDERRQQWIRARDIATEQYWSLQDLKDMHNSKSAIYSLAVELGIPDGMARRFKTELARFKETLKLEREAANSLSMLGSE